MATLTIEPPEGALPALHRAPGIQVDLEDLKRDVGIDCGVCALTLHTLVCF
jgi:hypothetical protein